MATKKTWKITKDFELNGVQYKEGDTFEVPADWTYDPQVKINGKVGGKITQHGWSFPVVSHFVDGDPRKPVMTSGRALLPVE